MTSLKQRIWPPVFAVLAWSLAACASLPTPVVAPRTAVMRDKAIFGVLISKRSVIVKSGDLSIQNGLRGVMTALQSTFPSGSINATEFMVQRIDGATVSFVASGSDLAAGGFPIGSRVEIVDGPQAELILAN